MKRLFLTLFAFALALPVAAQNRSKIIDAATFNPATLQGWTVGTEFNPALYDYTTGGQLVYVVNPSGGDASAANQTAVQANPGSDATKAVSIQGITGGKAVPVSGTFWQTTQPVSVSSLPLPSGAATEATLNTVASNTSNGDTTASGSITTQNLVPAGAATAGSSVSISTDGRPTVAVQITGTYTGALTPQATVDGATWVTLSGLLNANTGAYSATVASGTTGIFQVESAGFAQIRLTALSAVTGTASLSLRASRRMALIALDAPIPTGSNTIGAVTGSGTFTVGGAAAEDAVASGNPTLVGAIVRTALPATTVIAGDVIRATSSTSGQLVTALYSVPDLTFQVSTTITTSTQTAIRAAQGASIRQYVTSITYQNTNATATTVTVQDGASTTLVQFSAPASMANPVQLQFPTPLRGTANTALNYTAGTTGANVLLTVTGHNGY